MSTITTDLTLLSNKSNGGVSNTFYSVDRWYVGSSGQNYKIYYKIPIEGYNPTSLTLRTGIWVSSRGPTQSANFTARVYTKETDAQSFNSAYIYECSKVVKTDASGGIFEFVFNFTEQITASHLYIAFQKGATTNHSTSGAATKLFELIKYYTDDNKSLIASATITIPDTYTINIHNGQSYTPYQIYIYENDTNKYQPYIPYIYDGTKWIEYSG